MPEKMTKHGVRDLNHLGPKRPAYASDLATRRDQQLCEHKFEHAGAAELFATRYDACVKCRVRVVCNNRCGSSL